MKKLYVHIIALLMINIPLAVSAMRMDEAVQKAEAEMELEASDAIVNSDIDSLKKLISAGLDVNAQYPDGDSFLHMAVIDENRDIVKILIDAGANVNIKNELSAVPLSYAISYGYEDIIKLLIVNGAIEMESIQPSLQALALRSVLNNLESLDQKDKNSVINSISSVITELLDKIAAHKKNILNNMKNIISKAMEDKDKELEPEITQDLIGSDEFQDLYEEDLDMMRNVISKKTQDEYFESQLIKEIMNADEFQDLSKEIKEEIEEAIDKKMGIS